MEGDKEKLPEATKLNQSQTQQTIETEDGRLVKRRIAWRIIWVRDPNVGATATVGVAAFGATDTVGAYVFIDSIFGGAAATVGA